MVRTRFDTVGVRYTGWAALNRDPQEDLVESCVPTAERTEKTRSPAALGLSLHGWLRAGSARRDERLPQLQAVAHLSPVGLLHDQGEQRRFNAVFLADLEVSNTNAAPAFLAAQSQRKGEGLRSFP